MIPMSSLELKLLIVSTTLCVVARAQFRYRDVAASASTHAGREAAVATRAFESSSTKLAMAFSWWTRPRGGSQLTEANSSLRRRLGYGADEIADRPRHRGIRALD
jgi:hypothetical protein